MKDVVLLHGAGYVGGELIRLLLTHPAARLKQVTSRSLAGQLVWKAHPVLRGQTDLRFSSPEEVDLTDIDAVLLAAEHGKAAAHVVQLVADGFQGAIVDLSADFRFREPNAYPAWFGFEHPAPDLLEAFVYGLPELSKPYPDDVRYIANPGCFATALTLALWPLAQHLTAIEASVTAMTGASGSGGKPKATTHFPTRDGNLRAYKVLEHQHLPEVTQALGDHAAVAFVPVSGPWTRGIWGTAHVRLPDGLGNKDVEAWFGEAYDDQFFVRVWSGLPELRYAVGTPFADVGFVLRGRNVVVGFAIDNLLKGAASQAIQNLNLVLGLEETAGLLARDPVAA